MKAATGRILGGLGIVGPPEAGGQPLELVGRVDFACDFHTDAFAPDLAHVVAPSRTARRVNGHLAPEQHHACAEFHRGKTVENIRIGTMPGRQVAVYDKGKEIKASGKGYWRAAWGLPQDDAGQVWRVEVRAGKDALRAAGIVTFADLEQHGGGCLAGILDRLRYTTPTEDSNPARWPVADFWRETRERAAAMFNAPAGPMPEAAPLCREQKRDWYGRQLVAYLGGYAHLSDWPEAVDRERLGDALEALAREHQGTYRHSFERARRRYQAAP